MTTRDAVSHVLAQPREQRLRTLNRLLGQGPEPAPTSAQGMMRLGWNADLVTALRAECDRRGISTPWLDGRAMREQR